MRQLRWRSRDKASGDCVKQTQFRVPDSTDEPLRLAGKRLAASLRTALPRQTKPKAVGTSQECVGELNVRNEPNSSGNDLEGKCCTDKGLQRMGRGESPDKAKPISGSRTGAGRVFHLVGNALRRHYKPARRGTGRSITVKVCRSGGAEGRDGGGIGFVWRRRSIGHANPKGHYAKQTQFRRER
jgi:hypothetical protein